MRLDTSKIEDWRELCEWIERQPGRAAFTWEMPDHLKYLVSPYAVRVDLMQYVSQVGWHTVKGWREALGRMTSQPIEAE